MANGVTRDVKMVLGVETLGVEKFSELEKRLRDLAKAGGAGAEDFGRLADEIGRLGEQAGVVQAVKSLSAEFSDLAQRQQAAAEKVQAAKAVLDQLTISTDAARAAQEQARAALTAGEQAYAEAGNAIRAYTAGTGTAERQTSEYRAELQRLTVVQNEARSALIGLREENRQASAAAVAAAAEQRKAAAALAAASREQDQAATAADKHAAAMRRASQAAEAAGVNVRVLAAEEQRLRSALGSATQAATSAEAALDKGGAAAKGFRDGLAQISAGNLIADGIGYLVNKVKELGGAFVDAISGQEKLRRGLGAVFKDAELTAQQMQFLRNTASAAGISVSELEPAFIKFAASARAANIHIGVTNDVFRSVTGAASALGLSGSDVGGILEALGQMAGKGVVSLEELRQQLGDRLPGAMSLTAKGLGLTEAQLTKLVESGQLAARDALPAIAKGVSTLAAEGETLNGVWATLGTNFRTTAQDLGDAGWTDILTAALKVLGGLIASVGLGLSTLWEGFRTVAVGAAAVALAVKEGPTKALEMFNAETEKSVARLAAQADRFNAMLDPTSEAAKGLREAAAASASHANAAGQSASAARAAGDALKAQADITSSAAGSQKYAADVAKILADNSRDLSAKIVQVTVAAAEQLPVLEKEAIAADKSAKAAALQGAALETLAKLRGSEAEATQAGLVAAESNLEALKKAAAAHSAISETLQLERNEVFKLAAAEAEGVEGRRAAIEAIDKKLTVERAETEQAKAAVTQMESEVVARRVAVKTLQDNSAALDTYRTAAVSAEAALAAMQRAHEQGNATQAQVIDATRRAAEATAMYRDALKDAAATVQAKNQLEQANINVLTAGASVRQQAYQQLADAARANREEALAMGDSYRARQELVTQIYYEIEAKRLQIEITKLQAEARAKEAEAARLAAEAERTMLQETGALTEIKRLEIEARLANAKAKAIEAQASESVVRALEVEITALRLRSERANQNTEDTKANTAATDDAARASRERTTALDGEAMAVQNLSEQEQNRRRGSTKDGWAVNTQGNVVASGIDIAALAAKNTQTPDQAKAFEDVFNYYYQKAAQDPVNFSSTQGLQTAAVERAAIEASVAEAQRRTQATTATTSQTAGTSATASSTPVIINVGSTQTRVNVSSAADANTLAGLLGQLEAMRRVAA